MPSRQEQVRSHQFAVQRVVAAVVTRDTDPDRLPFRRVAGATLAGVLVATIGFGAVAAYAAITGSEPDDWRDPRAVIVERESGSRYAFRDGRLHPVANYTSALLIAGSGAKTRLVPRAALAGEPPGAPLGIADAPDPPPAPEHLVTGPWSACSATREQPVPLVGRPVPDSAPLAGRALLAEHPDGTAHLVWHDRRHLIRNTGLVLSALGWTGHQPVPVAPAVLGALGAGADLARTPIAGEGSPSRAVPGATVGEVFVVVTQGGQRQYAVAHASGLAAITQVEADLILTDLHQDRPTRLTQGEYADLPKVPGRPPAAAPPPATTPPLVPAGGAVCAQVQDAHGVPEVRLATRVPTAPVVEPGRGALVEAGGDVWLVTDRGRRHAITDPETRALLGYADTQPTRVPASFVQLVPKASELTREAALRPL
ncbi:type VII secretion protein EccB [Micromonospora sp. CPCC 206061]|uniref:type VII secretion protein EccB n=1 Tax=Micromonospora sp. CPCC 206061 TaxID=3122410 RepID=UPI002FEF43E6